MKLWIIPGAPLPSGQGWRVWCSREGEGGFAPPSVKVWRQEKSVPVEIHWELLPVLSGGKRRMGILSVKLSQGLPEGETFKVQIGENGEAETFHWSTLPLQVTDKGVTFLFASCFWQNNDREGYYRAGLMDLQRRFNPQFKLLLGDQIYGDWPNDWNLGDDEIELYAKRYRQYWRDGHYRQALQTCPNFMTCDDHEFWNDYPEKQLHLPQTWDPKNRKKYGHGAGELYYQYQQCLNPDKARWYSLTIDPVSFFVADTRSEREECHDRGTSHFMSPKQWADLEAWQQGLRGPGVLALGQPLFQKDGDFKDHSLSNFKSDYARLWRVLERSLAGNNHEQKAHDILILSGDIHTGRYAEAHGPFPDAPYGVPEFIASPAAMIEPGNVKPEAPPERIRVRPNVQGGDSLWFIHPQSHVEFMTIQNNVGLVRLCPGSGLGGAKHVRFELELWRLPAKVIQLDWDEEVPPQGTGGPLKRVFQKELLLR